MCFDLILIGIVLLCTLIGIKRGLVRSVYLSVARWGCVLVVCMLLRPVADRLSTTAFAHDIYDRIYTSINAGAAFNADAVAVNVTTSVLKGISFIGLFIIIRPLFFIAYKLLDSAAKLPAINSANRLLGAALGAANGILISCILLMAVKTALYFNIDALSVLTEGSVLLSLF